MTRRHRAALLALLALLAAGLLAPAAGEIQGAAAWVRVKNLLTPGSCATAGPCDLAAGTTVGGSPIGGGGAPTTADYLVGTANGSLSAEIVVGTSPGGELGGTWASPTIDSGVIDFSELSGSAIDSQIPNTITVDLATTATTANAGDSATAFFSSGTIEDARIDGAGEEDEIDLLDLRDSGTPTCTGSQVVRRNAGDTAWECATISAGGAPSTSDYLVGTADGGLSAEIVVGTSPGGELGGTWAIPTIDDAVTVSEWTESGTNFSAGSASAGSWPTLASGTVLTTAEDGAIEEDADAFYLTTDAGNRGVASAKHCIRADSTRNLNNVGTEQALFNSPTNGRLTLETGTYLFEGMFYLSAMSGTSGNAAIDPLGAGTATATAWLWQVRGLDNTTVATVGAPSGQAVITQQTAASAVAAGTGTAMTAFFNGTVEVTGAGTFIPSVTLVTAAAATLNLGSYFCMERIGSTTMTSVGQWD